MKQLFISSCIISGTLCLNSCIDKNYDFNNTNGDNLQIFDNISLPLGNTEKLTPSGYLNDIKEIKQNEKGEYIAIYSDTLQVVIPDSENLSIHSITTQSNRTIPFSDVTNHTLQTALQFTDNFSEAFLPAPINSEFIKQISILEFNTDNANSELPLSVSISGIHIKDQNQSKATLQLIAQFPDGSIISPQNDKQLIQHYNLSQGNNFSTIYKLSKLNSGQDNTILFTVILHIPAGETVTIHNPQIEVKTSLINPVVSALTGQFDFQSEVQHEIDMSSFYDFISDDPSNNLALAHPQLYIHSEATHGIPMSATGTISNHKKNETLTTLPIRFVVDKLNSEQMLQPQSFLFANEQPATEQSAQWIPLQLQSLINPIPDNISLNLKVSPIAGTTQRILSNSSMQLAYDLHMPLSFTDALHLTIRDTIFSVLDTDIRQKLFASGEAEIYGTIATTLPVDVTLELIPIDYGYHPVGITFEPQHIAASPDETEQERKISLFVGEKDIEKMRDAEHFFVFIRISSDQIDERLLKGSDYIRAKLSVRKKGGIAL